MGLDYPHLIPESGDAIRTRAGRFVRIIAREDQPDGQDTFVVEDNGEQREMHIDELSELFNTNTFRYSRRDR